MRTEHGGGVPDSATFAQTLSELKREGSNLLLVGQTGCPAHRVACRRFMGYEGEDDRHRVFVMTRDAEQCAELPAEAAVDGSTTVVRHADSEVGRPLPPTAEDLVVDSDLLSALGTTVLEAVDDIEAATDDLEPSELRLCLDSVRPLLQQHRSETVFRLLHMVTSRVRQSNGMGHFHLRLDHDNDYVRLLEPLFDAIVEIREAEGTVEQRWHLRDSEVTSDWLEF
jgi:hypothetical protein